MPNALSLFVLNDNNHRDHALYFGCACSSARMLLAGAYVEWRRHGTARGIVWLAALVGLPVFACAVSLVASERYATYRTIFAMTAVLLCFLVASIRALTESWGPSGRRMLATVVVSIAFFTAQHHVYALIAVPQGNEWQLIMAGAKHVHLDGRASAHFRHRLDSGGHLHGDDLSRRIRFAVVELRMGAEGNVQARDARPASRRSRISTLAMISRRAPSCRSTSASTSSSTCTGCISSIPTIEIRSFELR